MREIQTNVGFLWTFPFLARGEKKKGRRETKTIVEL
jgi:hypothetical protein